MRKIKLIFFIFVLLIAVFLIFQFSKIDTDFAQSKVEKFEFQVMNISRGGKIFKDIDMVIPLTLDEMKIKNDIHLKTDFQTSVELLYKGFFLNLLPGSYLFYNQGTGKLSFLTGELFWKNAKKGKIDILLGENKDKLTLSDSGRIKVTGNEDYVIWNYEGRSELKGVETDIELDSYKMYVFSKKNKVVTETIPVATNFISPIKGIVHLKKAKDSFFKLNWRVVPGVEEYTLKIYSSSLRDNVLLEKLVASNRISVNFLDFDENRNFYWEVFPRNPEGTEGAPSKMGYLKLIGVLIEEERDTVPPELVISSMSVNGNVVLIKGSVNLDSELFIDGVKANTDSNGDFYYTLKYKSLGLKTINFRVVSPADIETIQKRQVTIFEE